MGKTYRARDLVVLWCWRCGREFQATRVDAVTCGPTCRQAVSRDFRDGVFEALIYPFRWGPRAGRASRVYDQKNIALINAKRGRKWL